MYIQLLFIGKVMQGIGNKGTRFLPKKGEMGELRQMATLISIWPGNRTVCSDIFSTSVNG